MLPLVIVATLLAILIGAWMVMLQRRTPARRIHFVGPHCAGKTEATARLLGLPNRTVPTLGSHTTRLGQTEIVECVQDDLTPDFVNRFHINGTDRFIFFVKNEEEMRLFPDLTGFDVRFVMWKKMDEKKNTNLIYLDESVNNLLPLLK